MALNYFIKKPVSELMNEVNSEGQNLKKTLGAWSLIFLGIGAIIGAGLFVQTANAAAHNAGPSVTIAFIIAAIGCAFAGLCYAEFSSMIPIAGSAYTYSYATMGELMAWIIGWDLVLEYAVGAATVGIAWSEYFNNLLTSVMGLKAIPYEWCHSPFEKLYSFQGEALSFLPAEMLEKVKNGILIVTPEKLEGLSSNLKEMVTINSGIMNIPALAIVFILSLLLIRGMKESAVVNGIIVILKVAIVIGLIVLGWSFINPVNHDPYIPAPTIYKDVNGVSHHFGGIMGILGAAGLVFFAFIGFDAVSTAAQEAKNPGRDMPIGILGSLAICTVLYILFSHVLTGLGSVEEFRANGKEASVSYAIKEHMPGYGWLSNLVTIAILAGFSSVILVMLYGQSRVFYSMSRDGLIPPVFSHLHPKFSTPAKSNWIFCGFVGAFAAFVPGSIVGDMTSIGTLFAFILVCAGAWVMRVKHPEIERKFKVPYLPVVSILGILVCGAMIFGLGWTNWLRLLIWLLIGFIIYFGYSIHNSKLRNRND